MRIRLRTRRGSEGGPGRLDGGFPAVRLVLARVGHPGASAPHYPVLDVADSSGPFSTTTAFAPGSARKSQCPQIGRGLSALACAHSLSDQL